jgi:enoyl-CoA hydratase
MGNYTQITYDVDRGRAHIVLNRPEKLNALSETLLTELNDALWQADLDTRVHAVCLSGRGRAFSAGYDLSGAGGRRSGGDDDAVPRDGSTIDDDTWFMERTQRLRMVLFDMHKPVIAKVHGYCLAGGTDVALMCDMIIVADDARIGFPPARDMGVLPSNMWVYHCGPQWAKRLLLTGDQISGADAAKIGLVMKSVPADLLDREVDGLLSRLALIDPDLLSSNKRIVNIALELMGARTLQRLAVEMDARAHLARGAQATFKLLREEGVGGMVKARGTKFPDGIARVDEPEIRDGDGRFITPA